MRSQKLHRLTIMNETEYERLLGAAIRFVSFRPRSKKELRDFCIKTLKRHHTTAPLVIDQVIERMTELGYVNDDKFAEWWISQRTAFRPKGKRVIEAELLAKGIRNPEIDIDERTLAQKALERKKGVSDKQKLANFLYRRGFTVSVVDDILGKE